MQQINDHLCELRLKIDNVRESLRLLSGEVHVIRIALQGDLEHAEENSGLLSRVQRIESAEAKRARIEWSVLLSVAGLLAKALWETIRQRL